jgi:hypothetical protein
MSNNHFKERGLSLKAKGLLSLMLSLPDDWNYSISGLVKLSKDGKDSVMSALAELETFGYLTRVRTHNDKGHFSGVEYNIFEEPQGKKANAEKPNAEEAKAEKSNAEKPPQLNTKELNTKELNKKESNTNIYIENKDLSNIINENVVNEELRELYQDYIEMRKNMNQPITARGLKMLIKRCEILSSMNVRIQKLLLETSIINNWKNVYAPNEKEVANMNKAAVQELKQFYGLE